MTAQFAILDGGRQAAGRRILGFESRSSAGTAMLEFSIVVSLLLIFTLELFDVGNLLFHHSLLTQLARDGIRYGETIPNLTDAQAKVPARVQLMFDQLAADPAGMPRLMRFAPGSLVVTVTHVGPDVHLAVEANYKGLFAPFRNFSISAQADGPTL